jgi:hypothetical protein
MKATLLQRIAGLMNTSTFRVNGTEAKAFSRKTVSGIVWSDDTEQHAIAYFHGGKFHAENRSKLLPRNCPKHVIDQLNGFLKIHNELQAA